MAWFMDRSLRTSAFCAIEAFTLVFTTAMVASCLYHSHFSMSG
jgi:hypothetical protein